MSLELVTADGDGRVRASAMFATSGLEPPFAPAGRAVLSRFAADPALDAARLVAPLVALGQRLAAQSGAAAVELTELSPPSTALHGVALDCGAVPWSRILIRVVSPRSQF